MPGHSALPSLSQIQKRQPPITDWGRDTLDPPHGDPIPDINLRSELGFAVRLWFTNVGQHLDILNQVARIGPEPLGLGVGVDDAKRARLNVAYLGMDRPNADQDAPQDLRIAEEFVQRDALNHSISTVDRAFEYMIVSGETGGRFTTEGPGGSLWILEFTLQLLDPNDPSNHAQKVALTTTGDYLQVPLPAIPPPPEFYKPAALRTLGHMFVLIAYGLETSLASWQQTGI